MPLYCFKCPCGRREDRSLPMAGSLSPQVCDCGELMSRDRAAEVQGTPAPRRELQLSASVESPMSDRVRKGEFDLYKNFVEIGGPKLFES